MSAPLSQKEYWSGKVGEEWAARAQQLDAMLSPMSAAALALAAIKPGERVLDIGCGAGATSLEIARRGGLVTGVDLSPQLLRLARTRAEAEALHATFIEADAGEAALGASFDAAFSRFGVMFFERPDAAFANIRAQLKPNGALVFVCWRTLAENVWAKAPIEAIVPMLKAPLPPPDPDAPGPFAFADADKISAILSAAGWRDIAITPWDGDIIIGGGGTLAESAEFMLHIGPCARAIADQDLDAAEAHQRLMDKLAPLHTSQGAALAAACWLVRATA